MSKIREKKLSSFKIKPLVSSERPEDDPKKILGGDLIPRLYSRSFFLASTNSGKTTVIANYMEECIDRRTKVFLFVSTVDLDPSWQSITKRLDDRKIEYVSYTSIFDDDGQNLIDSLLEDFRDVYKAEKEAEEDEKGMEQSPETVESIRMNCLRDCILTVEKPVELSKKKRKYKYLAPKYLLVLDDLSQELRNTSITVMLKKCRHYGIKVFISSQSLFDLPTQSITQLSDIFIFKGQPLEKIRQIYDRLKPPISYELFEAFYTHATKEKYSFLYYCVPTGEFRKNSNMLLSAE